MKRSRMAIAALLATFASVAPSHVYAQGIGVAVGTLVPQGSFADAGKTGLAAIASFEFGGRTALRVEGLWANSDLKGAIIKDANGVPLPDNANVSGDVKVIGALGSIVFHLVQGPVQPYLVGGAGYYNRNVSQNAKDAASGFGDLSLKESKVGIHVGAGLKLTIVGISAFAEARYHTVKTDEEKTNFVPLVVGIRF